MKVVIDTNVLISALIFTGFSADVYDFCILEHEPCISERIIGELKVTLRKKLGIASDSIDRIESLVRKGCGVYNPKGQAPKLCRDPDDNHILLLAGTLDAEFIITGDSDLLDLIKYLNTRIVSPRQFWIVTHKRS